MTSSRSGLPAAIPIIGALGVGGSSLLVMGCCMAPSVMASALTAAGLGVLLSLDMGETVPIVYAMAGLSLAGIAWASRRSRRWSPLGVATVGSAALLIPFHEALDVSLFYLLVVGGQATLLAAAALAWGVGRRCRLPAPAAGPAP